LCSPGPLPTFKPTSNPELDSLLDLIRNELFIPTHLLKRHKTLQTRQKNHAILEEETVAVDMPGSPPVVLTPKQREVPVPIKLFGKALRLMKEPSDLDAIPGLVLGFAQANRRIREEQAEKMARLMNLNGRIDLLMALARGAGENGFKFTQPTAREFMRGIRIQNSVPDRKTALLGLKHAEQLLNCLGEPTMKVDPNARLKRDPVVVGTVLAMFASTSKRFNGGKDYGKKGGLPTGIDGYTRHYTQRLKKVWEHVEWELNLVKGDKPSVWRAKYAVLDYIPVLEGLLNAREILEGSDLSPWIEAESARLNGTIAGWKQFLAEEAGDDKSSLLGVHSYKEVVEKLALQLPEGIEEEAEGEEFEMSESSSESESSDSEADEAKR
jgi:hypothetical protein